MTNSYFIVGGTLIDGTNNKPLENSVICINGKIIEEVSILGKIKIPKNARIINVKGMSIIPGLIDSHIHLPAPRDPDEPNIMFSILKTPSPLVTIWAIHNAQRCLEAGFTTLRDFGGIFNPDNLEGIAIRKGIEMGLIDGPRILAGGSLAPTSSHPEISALGLISPHIKLGENAANGPWEVRKRVRKLVGLGVDFIKMFASAWFGELERYWWPNYSFEEMKAICEEAHRYRKRVAVHATTSSSVYNAIKAGCDTVEHLVEMDKKTLDLILEKNIIVIPTLYIFSEASLKKRMQHQKASIAEQIRSAREKVIKNFKTCLEAGVKFATGTDTYRTIEHGDSAKEISQMVKYGMCEKEAIIASTKNAAEALGLESDLGIINKGKLADLLVIKGNPLENIKILEKKENIMLVIREGEIKVDRR